MAYVADIRIGGTPLTQRFADMRAAFATAREQRRVYNTTFNELNSLTDRDLTDLGIARSNIAAIAHEAAFK